MKNKYFPSLADPITINGVTFKNRIFGAPMSNPELDPDCHMRTLLSMRTGAAAALQVSASVLVLSKRSDVPIQRRSFFMTICRSRLLREWRMNFTSITAKRPWS